LKKSDNMDKLNIGCGRDIRKGYVNLDVSNIKGVNIVHDLNSLPLPFDDNVFDEILCKDVLEHVEYTLLLKELHRILKPNGRIIATFPHFTSLNNYIDPTHRHMFSIRTFGFFTRSNPYLDWNNRNYYFDFSFNKLIKSKITFTKFLPYNIIVEFFVNLHPKIQTLYEMTFISRLFPAENIEIEIEK